MPNDLTITSVQPVRGTVTAPEDPVKTAPTPPRAPAAGAFPNPTLRIDPAAGVVVLEFRDSAGKIADSIPTPRQLQAYRNGSETPDGVKPKVA